MTRVAVESDTVGVPCGTCRQLLGRGEQATCRACVADVRAALRGIVDGYAVLPLLLDSLGSNAPKRNPGGGGGGDRERPLPGGDPLVMLGPGSGGDNVRRADTARLRVDPGAVQLYGRDDADGDPVSVSHELGRWEDDWRRLRGEPGAPGPAYVSTAVDYLTVNVSWAASRHPAFREFADDMRRLRWQLEAVTRTEDRPVRASAPCFEPRPTDDDDGGEARVCGGVLERHYLTTGLQDDWVCRRCKRVYDQAGYWLAVRSQLERAAARAAEAEEGEVA